MFGIRSKIAQITASPENAKSLQKAAKDAFKRNLKELEKFTSKEMPKVAESHKDALKGLEQLSKNIRGTIK